jgi:hypothetical protein
MIIDNPHVMREVIQEAHPYFTHDGADEIYTERKDEMDHYAESFGKLADEVWKREYLEMECEPTPSCPGRIEEGFQDRWRESRP